MRRRTLRRTSALSNLQIVLAARSLVRISISSTISTELRGRSTCHSRSMTPASWLMERLLLSEEWWNLQLARVSLMAVKIIGPFS